jgi:hypothetical protein
MIHSIKVGFGFGSTIPIDQVSGKQARITIGVVGSDGTSATDEKLVTLTVTSAVAPGAGAPLTIDRAP